MRKGFRIPVPTVPRRVLLGMAVLLCANLATAFSHLAPTVKWPARPVATVTRRVSRVGFRTRVRSRSGWPVKSTAEVLSPAPRSLTVAATRLITVAHPAFPVLRAPSALVYVPAGIDRAQPLNLVVFIHGWNGCAASVSADVPTECHPDGTRRGALALVSQVRTSGVAAVLVVPQMALEARTSDPGRFRDQGYFRQFMEDVLRQMEPELGAHRVDDLGRVVLASHSGGYVTLLTVLQHGGVKVDEIAMFDSFYDGVDTLGQWVSRNADRFDPTSPDPARLVSVYRGGGTEAASVDLAHRVSTAFGLSGHGNRVLLRTEQSRLTEAEARSPLVMARVPGNHQEAVRWNLAATLRGAGLPRVVSP